MLPRSALCIGVVGLLAARPAAADDFTAFITSVAAKPNTAYLAKCDLLVAPNGDARRPCTITLADLGGAAGMTLAVTKTKEHAFTKNPFAWREAEVQLKDGAKVVATFRVVDVGNGSAQHWAKLISDKDSLALAKAGKLKVREKYDDSESPQPKGMSDEFFGDREEMLNKLKWAWMIGGDMKPSLAKWLDDGATMLGTSSGEVLAGKSGAKAMRGWNITLTHRDGSSTGGNDRQLVYGAFQVTGATKDKLAIPYVALIVLTAHMTPGGGSLDGSVALVSFAIPQ